MTPPDREAAGVGWKDLLGGGHLPRFLVLCFGVWLHAADSTLVATVMPSAVADIGGVAYVSWAISLYMLGSIVASAASALLAATFGLRVAMAGSALLYGVGCAASALAPDMATMLLGRLLQGLGGGGMLALSYIGVSQLFPASLLPRLMAAMSSVWGVSAFCGPLIGGFFASLGLWRFGFWAFAAQSLLLALVVFWVLEADRPAADAEKAFVPYRRLALLTGAILAISFAGAEVSLTGSSLLCLAGLLMLAVLVWRDGHAAVPLFPSRPLDLSHWVGAGTVMTFAFAAATISFTTYGPLLMQLLYGADPLTAGYIVTLESIAWTVAAIAVAGARPAAERTIIRLGSVGITLGVVGFAVTMPDGSLLLLLPWAALQGAGFGLAWAFIVRRVVAGAPPGEQERASSALPTTQHIGYALGAALAGIVANAGGFADGISPGDAEAVGFWVFAAFIPLALLGNLAAWRLTREPTRRRPSLEAA